MLARSHLRGAKSPVSTIMTRDFEVVRDDLDVDRLAKRLLARRLSCAAVSDANGNLIGFVSMIDLVRDRYLNGETEAESSVWTIPDGGVDGELESGFHLEARPARVRDIMMPCVLRISADAGIDEAAALMASEGVHRIVVVASKRVVGMVSALDILTWLARRDGFVVREHPKSSRRSACEYAVA
jgi:predicted transcriptional regulator